MSVFNPSSFNPSAFNPLGKGLPLTLPLHWDIPRRHSWERERRRTRTFCGGGERERKRERQTETKKAKSVKLNFKQRSDEQSVGLKRRTRKAENKRERGREEIDQQQ